MLPLYFPSLNVNKLHLYPHGLLWILPVGHKEFGSLLLTDCATAFSTTMGSLGACLFIPSHLPSCHPVNAVVSLSVPGTRPPLPDRLWAHMSVTECAVDHSTRAMEKMRNKTSLYQACTGTTRTLGSHRMDWLFGWTQAHSL
jgi:hypothetical protein